MSRYLIQLSTATLWILLAASVLFPVCLVKAAHSRRRQVIVRPSQERYDRSITTFDPSGRLLQVEYAMHASSRGSTIVGSLSLDQAKLYIVVQHPQGGTKCSFQQVHRLDDHVFLFGTGLVGDTLFLARYLRRWCRVHRIEQGEPARIQEVAEEASLFQHEQTRTGGRRPFGCSIVVAGVDPFIVPFNTRIESKSPAKKHAEFGAHLKLFRSGPGGVLEYCLFCAIGRQNDVIMNAMQQGYQIMQDEEPATERNLQNLVSLLQTTTGTKHGCDVWVIEPAVGRRGNMKTSCHLNITETSSEDSGVLF